MPDFFDNSKKVIDDLMYSVIDVVPDKEWETISYSIMFPDRTCFQVESVYTKNGQTTSFPSLKDASISDKIWDLEKLYFSDDKGRLTKASFVISSTGKFDVKFEYDNNTRK